jgi:hypothetical protein
MEQPPSGDRPVHPKMTPAGPSLSRLSEVQLTRCVADRRSGRFYFVPKIFRGGAVPAKLPRSLPATTNLQQLYHLIGGWIRMSAFTKCLIMANCRGIGAASRPALTHGGSGRRPETRNPREYCSGEIRKERRQSSGSGFLVSVPMISLAPRGFISRPLDRVAGSIFEFTPWAVRPGMLS